MQLYRGFPKKLQIQKMENITSLMLTLNSQSNMDVISVSDFTVPTHFHMQLFIFGGSATYNNKHIIK